MPRPYTTTEGRGKPQGREQSPTVVRDPKIGRGGLPGLSFSRVAGIRRIRSFVQASREVLRLSTAEEDWEAEYQAWYATWRGTRPEYIVFDYLSRRRKYRYGIDFAFQSSFMGGRQRQGGSVVDFEVYKDRVYIRVQGERFHLGPEKIAEDTIQAVSIMRTGWPVVDIWAEQVTAAPRTVIEAALKGITLRAGVNP